MQHQDIVASLRAELLQAKGEIMALKEGKTSLQEQVEQLQEQLKVSDDLLRKKSKKLRARLRAYIDCLAQLTEYQVECEDPEASVHQEPAQPETSWSRELGVDEENEALKEQVNVLKTGQRRLEDELKKKDELIVTTTKRRGIQTNTYLDSLVMLTVKENEVKRSQAETQEARLQRQTTPTEGVSSRKVDAVEKENKTMKEQVHKLKCEQTKLQEEVRHKEELVKNESRKRAASVKLYLGCLNRLSDMENKLEHRQVRRRRRVAQLETVKVEDQDELLNQETDYPPKTRGTRGRLP
nr:PREDICTED: tropomyosin-like [Paralichthys olivaceus]